MASPKENKPKHHHYVPEFLLKRFSIESKEKQVWCFQKADQRAFIDSVDRAGGQHHWHQYELPNGQILEEALSPIETKARQALDRVIKTERTNVLSRSERYDIAVFVAFQL